MTHNAYQLGNLKGYRRENGRWGCRNLVLVMAAADNVNPLGRQLVAHTPQAVFIPATFGRGQLGEDFETSLRTMAGMATHPNVAACLVLSYEPEAGQKIVDRCGERRQSIETLSILATGGLYRSLERGSEILQGMIAAASRQTKEQMPSDQLIIGLECGGSDATSGLVSNPAIGLVADKLLEADATLIFSEPVELVGCETITDSRAATPEVAREIRTSVETYVNIALNAGIDLLETNPTPDNIDGGLSTIEEKSLGAILKTGRGPIEGVLPYGAQPPRAGLWLMDAPAAAVENLTALAAGGCQVILFATGTVNPVGNPISATIKICANPESLTSMGEHVDVDLTQAHAGAMTMEEAGRTVEDALYRVLSGSMTAADRLHYVETRISRFGQSV